jgi:hypothetical protein
VYRYEVVVEVPSGTGEIRQARTIYLTAGQQAELAFFVPTADDRLVVKAP